MRRAALLWCLAVAACSAPSDPAGWAKQAVRRNRLDEKLAALEQVRKAPGDRRAAAPYLVEVLGQHPRARGEAAVALGEIGDPSLAKPLLDAVDLAATDRDTIDANRKIAAALGALRAREAVPKLVEMTGSADAFTQVAAVDALGEIGDPAAVDRIVAVAADERTPPFTVKKALLALGRIGDPRAAPTVLRMLFVERPGVSYFPEAAFAASQIGPPMVGPLLEVLEGRDAKLEAWARENGVVRGALYAKAAQLLGDVGDERAVPGLLRRLSYQEADPGLQLLVRVFAAESLGRLRARAAARPLAEEAARERNPDVRDRYCDALARIGDPAALPGLRAAAAAGEFDLREGPLVALSRIGGEAELATVGSARSKDCGSTCPAAQERAYAGMVARLDAARACRGEAACWTGKLSDPSAAVRDRAALEVGRAGGPAQAEALAAAIVRQVDGDDDLAARYHAVLALGWIVRGADLGASGAGIADQLDRMIASEKGRSLTAGVNEDALRLATRLRRGARG
jgi:HEAT repeat protein